MAKHESNKNRKFEKKLQFYSKVRERVAALAVKKTNSKKNKLRRSQRKLKAFNLSALSDLLPELEASANSISRNSERQINLTRGKSRQNLLLKENEKFGAVMRHPAFQADPLSAIYQHLKNTQLPIKGSESNVCRKKKAKGEDRSSKR